MTFINEVLSDEESASVDWTKFTRSPLDSAPNKKPATMWTIDRDRGVFFIPIAVGKDDGPPSIFGLSIKGEFIRVLANDHYQRGEKLPRVSWDILRVSIPVHLEGNRSEILQLLVEAIKAYGSLHKPADVGPIKFHF